MNLFKKHSLNIVFALHVAFFGLVVTGILPRSLVLYETIALLTYTLLAPLEDGVIFFVRCIPLFIAIPLTASFDNFNQWRILSIILFAKWLVSPALRMYIVFEAARFFLMGRSALKRYKPSLTLIALGALALLSVLVAPDKGIALKRIIYFCNASLIGIVVWQLTQQREFAQRVIKNVAIPTIIVAVVGAIQVASTYFIDIYQFMRIWGEGIQLNQFGTQWSYIATHVGNTWFAYYGDQLSLRVFSLFPDSHSFPIFLLLGVPALFAISLLKPLSDASSLKKLFRTRGSLNVLWIPLVFLLIILTGTRGMWLAGAGAIVWSVLILLFLKYKKEAPATRNAFAYVSSFLALFVLLFAVAYPILSSPQFLVSKPDALLLQHRLRSVLDFGETSNAARIAIWKSSATSIAHHPLLGIGIGNFPVVLGQDILLSRAGSSAHNIYIHLASEMGLAAFLVSLYLLWLIVQALYLNYVHSQTPFDRAWTAALLITLPWIFAYLMTDVALFDERALLLFAVTLGLIFRGHE